MGQLINQFIVYTVGGFHNAHRVIIYIKSLNVLQKAVTSAYLYLCLVMTLQSLRFAHLFFVNYSA